MISESVTHVVTILIRDVLTVIAAIALMIYQSPRLFMMVALVLPVIAVLIKVLGSAFRRYSGKIQHSVGEVTQVSEEVLIGNKIVKIFGGNDYEMNRLINIDESNPSAPVFTIESPLNSEDNELRYGIFRYRPGKKESIIAGVKSWAGE